MKNWKQLFVFTFVFLFFGLCLINAQDVIVLKDGNMIEARVIEISPSEIRYRRIDNLSGPIIIISRENVLSIRYENGTYEMINEESTNSSSKMAMDPNKLIIGINGNPAGLLLYGPTVTIDFSKGNFTSDVNIIIPYGLAGNSGGGVGILGTFNYIWHSRIGGFYLGGGFGYIWTRNDNIHTEYDPYTLQYETEIWDSHVNILGLNIGYRFVTSSGMYFKVGAYASISIDWADLFRSPLSFYIKPDLTIGYSF